MKVLVSGRCLLARIHVVSLRKADPSDPWTIDMAHQVRRLCGLFTEDELDAFHDAGKQPPWDILPPHELEFVHAEGPTAEHPGVWHRLVDTCTAELLYQALWHDVDDIPALANTPTPDPHSPEALEAARVRKEDAAARRAEKAERDAIRARIEAETVEDFWACLEEAENAA